MPALAVDFSSGGGAISQATINAWKQAGVSTAIAQYSEMLPQHLEELANSGLIPEAYVYLYFPLSPWQQTPEDRVKACLGMVQGTSVKRIWLDVEDPGDHDTPANIIASIGRCVDLIEARGLQAGIYTGRYKYPERVGDSTAFAHLPLWHADYINRVPGEADFAAFVPYNGWTAPLLWQYEETTDLGGHTVDISAFATEANSMANLNADGSQKIVSEGNFVILYNGGVPVRRWGSTDGLYPGRESKLFGNTYLWFRTLDPNGQLVAPYWSPDEGD